MDRYGYETANAVNYKLLKQFSIENRKDSTGAEDVMWSMLRRNALGVYFRRQHIIGDYIADFVCLTHRLVIEIDGLYHNSAVQATDDAERSNRLGNYGYTVLRFTNNDVLRNRAKVISTIKERLNQSWQH